MQTLNRALLVVLAFAFTSSGNTYADTPTFGVKNTTSSNTMQDSKSNAQKLDCTQSRNDPRCNYPSRPRYPVQQPDHYPPSYQQRPVIINQIPEQPAIDINSLTDDWEGCRAAKLGAIRARNSGQRDQANDLDEWLWKNCRSYSNELRDLE
ncbi:MAG: hypothetical protein QM709_06580 [Spongiibacteraceae bacterium]